MTIIHDAYINALLADAAYVSKLSSNDTGKVLADKLSLRMTPMLAKYIGDHFSVVTQVSSPNSSFDVTVCKKNWGVRSYILHQIKCIVVCKAD
ncbi:hypothetical protein ACFQNF_16460 [Iodobacter arcticus]|uniref:Uncharacterized protein n=1 Tax=Iodobacter arcticus TaxID=590593 RepID=A0ABW2R0Y4_9NEIS